jgi:hypothetical protein
LWELTRTSGIQDIFVGSKDYSVLDLEVTRMSHDLLIVAERSSIPTLLAATREYTQLSTITRVAGEL